MILLLQVILDIGLFYDTFTTGYSGYRPIL